MLAVFYPAGGAGGDEGQDAAVLHTVNKLVGLLHDGKVCGEVRIKYLVKAQTPQGGCHPALHVGADGKAEFLAESGADSGCGLHNYMLLRVRDGREHFLGAVLFLKGTGGTYGDTLAAGHTGGLSQPHAEGGANLRGEAAVVGADNADSLYILTHSHAAAAEDALAVVANHMSCGIINLRGAHLAVIIAFILHAQVVGQLLELAVSAAHAGEAGTVVVGEKKLDGLLAGIHNPGGVGEHLHALLCRVDAGGDQLSIFQLYNTNAAGADFIDFL